MRRLAPIPLSCLLAGCNRHQSALLPAGEEASRIYTLLLIFTVVAVVVWLAVMIALAVGLRHGGSVSNEPERMAAKAERARIWVVWTATVLTALTIIALALASYTTDRSIAAPGSGAVTIRLIGHQWWWEATYEDPVAGNVFTTANELHVPVGERVKLTLQSTDVIHSFWVPNLVGKEDLIPGWNNELTFTADKVGSFRGQCAEFCGFQHAYMGLLVVVESREAFDRWRLSNISAARTPPGTHGEQLFMTTGCALCHTIRGTNAGGRMGPDLTHVGSRKSLAADTLENTQENLVGWIADPQGIKPGSKMPRPEISDEDIAKVATWLEGLK